MGTSHSYGTQSEGGHLQFNDPIGEIFDNYTVTETSKPIMLMILEIFVAGSYPYTPHSYPYTPHSFVRTTSNLYNNYTTRDLPPAAAMAAAARAAARAPVFSRDGMQFFAPTTTLEQMLQYANALVTALKQNPVYTRDLGIVHTRRIVLEASEIFNPPRPSSENHHHELAASIQVDVAYERDSNLRKRFYGNTAPKCDIW